MSQGFAQPTAPGAVHRPTLDAASLGERLKVCFSNLDDPRVERGQLHQLHDVVVIAILAIIAGGRGWEDMEFYGTTKQAWLSTFLALPNGIPSPDTFRRVFEAIEPQQLEACFERWVRLLVEDLGVQVVAIDGKTLKGSYNRNQRQSALHLVSAWATEHRLVLAQTKVHDKSNEITAIPALLELLDLAGCIVTLDAMGTQKMIAAQIQAAKADYILSLKANHPTLLTQVRGWFEAQRQAAQLPPSTESKLESGHHRIETRRVWCFPLISLPPLHEGEQWKGLQTIVVVERIRHLWNKTTHEVQFYLSSLPADSPRIGAAIRQHWSIENSQHWVLDVTFGEDACRVRCVHAPHNLAVLRRFALNALRRESTSKRSLKQKSKQSAMSDDYMMKVLAAALPDSAQDSSPKT